MMRLESNDYGEETPNGIIVLDLNQLLDYIRELEERIIVLEKVDDISVCVICGNPHSADGCEDY